MVASGSRAHALWTVVAQGSAVNYDQAQLLDRLERALSHGSDETATLLTSTGPDTAAAIMSVLTHIVAEDDLIRAANLISSMLECGPTGVKCVVDVVLKKEDHFTCFLNLLRSGNELQRELAATVSFVMGQVYMHVAKNQSGSSNAALQSVVETQLLSLMSYICSQLRDETLKETEVVKLLQALGFVLRSDSARRLFCNDQSTQGVSVVARLVDEEMHHQIQALYQAVFLLWLLSFASEGETAQAVSQAMDEASVPRRLSLLLREVTAEKVVRVCVSTLNNLTKSKFSPRLRREMVGAGITKTVEQLSVRRWADIDIVNDMSALGESLRDEQKLMSTFEVYHHEVLSGALQWTHVHSDDMFWRDNVEKLESNNMEVLRCLVRLLNQSSDPMVLSVACNDLAMFVKYHPRGRYIAQSLGMKTRLMQLMTSENPDVRRHALNCVQVIMITHW
eukprot:CAMPEP_0185848552 /NCGR_PEP_ID=MMETSP1354-20130828/3376_1 /TAXON_ID=708628 /ORGANISM="Erythrolobus madagascarensis, Strain CCMP3276" /LENGTH=449 /DNA_ID=CAMNT_0028548959 /DNA_START=12 /DNA_END=1358 /DNA_ORIENTATION=+